MTEKKCQATKKRRDSILGKKEKDYIILLLEMRKHELDQQRDSLHKRYDEVTQELLKNILDEEKLIKTILEKLS